MNKDDRVDELIRQTRERVARHETVYELTERVCKQMIEDAALGFEGTKIPFSSVSYDVIIALKKHFLVIEQPPYYTVTWKEGTTQKNYDIVLCKK